MTIEMHALSIYPLWNYIANCANYFPNAAISELCWLKRKKNNIREDKIYHLFESPVGSKLKVKNLISGFNENI